MTVPDTSQVVSREPQVVWPELRVGQGFDVHPFSEDPSRLLILGGVVFEGAPGLAGHSDADAVAHAITDALLGAAGLGDIGQHFSDTDPQWKGADSMGLLDATLALVRADGWNVANVDCTVVLEAPKLAPHRATMAQRLTSVVGAPVSVKAKRAEGLGAIGRREGIACFAVALLIRTAPGANELNNEKVNA
jgi:2-C-methyl-D-erythritol 2,4-cyclodiphosphate synthase